MASFATLYRPANLDQIIGHEAAVTRLRGIIESKKIPNALAFFGPTSAGKTTMARAFAAEVNGLKNIGESRDYCEINGSSERNIDDVREMIKQSKFKPQHNKRIICVDEAHGLLANSQATNAFLKPLEEPSKDTIWIICSMEPSKFQAKQEGRAMLNRASQFVLEAHTPSDLLKMASRIAKAEKMTYVLDEEKTVLKAVAKSCQEMRTLCNTMEALHQYYHGLKVKPKFLSKDSVTIALKSTESSDEALALVVMSAVYQGSFSTVQKSLLNVQDGFMFINKLMWFNKYVLNMMVLKGERHPKVWGSQLQKDLAKKAVELKLSLGVIAACNEALVEIKGQAQQFATSPEELLSAKLYHLIKEIHTK